jgi:hypothetical protein
MKPIHDLLLKFIEQNELRPELNQPFEQDGLVIVSTSHCLIAFDKADVSEKYDCQDKPRASGLVKAAPYFNNSFDIDVLRSQIKNKVVDEMDDSQVEECSFCGGEGEIECSECGQDYDCPKCHGDGTIGKSIPTGRKINDPNQIFTIRGAHFRWNILERLFITSEYLEVKHIEYNKFDPSLSHYFRVGNAIVLLMPCISQNEENIITI